MKIFVLFFLTFFSLQGTTLTGTLNGPDGTGVNGTLYMSLSQQAALMSTGGCGGPVEVVPGLLGPQAGYAVAIKVVNGAMQGTPTVYGNDCMLPGGLYYNVQLVDNNGNTYFTDKWQITGSTLNVGTIVSVVISGTTTTLGSTGFVQLVPAVTQIINQPPSTYLSVNTLAVTGTMTFPDGSQCTTAGCFAANSVLLTGNQTISGVKTFANDANFNGAVNGTTANFTGNGYVAGTFYVGSTTINCGRTGAACYGQITTSINGTAYNFWRDGTVYPLLNYLWSTSTPTITWGGSMLPGATSYNLGSLALPWNSIWAQNATVTGSLTMGAASAFYNRVFSGSDISCTGVADGWMGWRTDTHQLELCAGGTLYKILGS